ncbi:DUF4376 domain-containing protein [Hoylesella timonensis]|uniref:DUF4376 domain-containing protein n=1 Tax=Hoylesella timonensis TaxID=386414 RepID=UPI00189B2520|nr:DUF4376 domain-containing protein [Hoylesella timonensis]
MKQWKKDGQAYQGEPMEIEGKRVYNPTDEMLMRAGYVCVEDVEEELQRAKEVKIAEIASYSDSDAVNSLTFNGIKTWLTRTVRDGYNTSITAAKNLGEPNVTFMVGDNEMQLPVEQARRVLDLVQRYADACFLVTERHKRAVRALQTVDEVESYDYTKGYPEKLAL